MTVTVTWPNLYKLAGLVIVVLTLMLSIGSIMVNFQMQALDRRLEERLRVYQADQIEMRHRIERLENHR